MAPPLTVVRHGREGTEELQRARRRAGRWHDGLRGAIGPAVESPTGGSAVAVVGVGVLGFSGPACASLISRFNTARPPSQISPPHPAKLPAPHRAPIRHPPTRLPARPSVRA